MTRQKTLLSILAAVLLVILAFVFLLRPQMTEADEVRQEIEDTRAQQAQLESQIVRLEDVRARSPEIEALVAAADTLIPRDDPALPAAVRQLQMAANDSGAQLVSVAMSRPAVTEATNDVAVPPGLATIATSVTVSGGYFQLVDFLRRVEDPVISPRAILWNQANVTLAEYPTLTMNLSGALFAYLEDIGAPAPAPPTEEPTDGETDVDVDVDVTETEVAQ